MTRIIYYTIHCTVEERDNGKDHFEKFKTQEEAIKRANELPADEFISVEKCIQEYTLPPFGREYKNDELGWETIKTEPIDF